MTRGRSFPRPGKWRWPSRSSSSSPDARRPPPKPPRRTPAPLPARTTCSTRPSAGAAWCVSTPSRSCSISLRRWTSNLVPSGPNLTIVTNAGGPAVLATDALLGDGGKLTELSSDTIAQLNQCLPAPLEPSESDRHHRRRRRGPLRQGGRDRGQGSRDRRPAGDSGANRTQRSHRGRGTGETLLQTGREAGNRQLDGRARYR